MDAISITAKDLCLVGVPVGASLATPAGADKRRPYKTEGILLPTFLLSGKCM